jgi:hypothetical protein
VLDVQQQLVCELARWIEAVTAACGEVLDVGCTATTNIQSFCAARIVSWWRWSANLLIEAHQNSCDKDMRAAGTWTAVSQKSTNSQLLPRARSAAAPCITRFVQFYGALEVELALLPTAQIWPVIWLVTDPVTRSPPVLLVVYVDVKRSS